MFVCWQADATLDMERRDFYQSSMRYVLKLQEVQERKKFEFVEIVSTVIFLLFWTERCKQTV